MPGYILDEELKRTIQQVCAQFLNSFQPRPKRGRRVLRRGGGGGSSTVAATMLVLTEDIDAAAGDTSSITPASALAQKYATNSETGERTPTEEDPLTIYNYDTCQGYTSGTQVWVAGAEGDFPEILSAACCQLSEPA